MDYRKSPQKNAEIFENLDGIGIFLRIHRWIDALSVSETRHFQKCKPKGQKGENEHGYENKKHITYGWQV
ncbi:MAG: hypothetical protein ACYS14_04605, partial [Planctomycetota bacterium]